MITLFENFDENFDENITPFMSFINKIKSEDQIIRQLNNYPDLFIYDENDQPIFHIKCGPYMVSCYTWGNSYKEIATYIYNSFLNVVFENKFKDKNIMLFDSNVPFLSWSFWIERNEAIQLLDTLNIDDFNSKEYMNIDYESIKDEIRFGL